MTEQIESVLRRGLATLADRGAPVNLSARALRRARRIRARRATIAGVVVLAVLVATGAAYAAVHRPPVPVHMRTCTATDLPTVLPVPPGGYPRGWVWTDPTGRYAVSGNVLWTDGRPQIIPSLETADVHNPTSLTAAWAVNAQGVVVGEDNHGSWVYRDGTVTALPRGMSIAGIDSAGDIAATQDDSSQTAVVLPAGGTQPRVLAAPPGSVKTGAVAMGPDGTVVGFAAATEYIDGPYPYVWGPDGTGHRLAMPPGAYTGTAMAVSGDWVAGWVAFDPDLYPHEAVRWNLRTGEMTVYPGNPLALQGGVDSGGDLVIMRSERDTGGAYLFRDVTRIPLALPPGADRAEYTANSISSDGGVIGGFRSVTTPHGEDDTPLLWRCSAH